MDKSKRLNIGDPVLVKKVALRGCVARDVEIPATVCVPQRADGVVGVVYKDGYRQMIRSEELG